MIVYLIGFMGSGKSTFGRRMASRAGWEFADLDLLIENTEGRSVEDIFRDPGEEYFRDIEARTLRQIPLDNNMVIACGGGTPSYRDNMEYMNSKGVTVYLKHDVATLLHRLARAKKVRPLIKDMSSESLENYISKKLAEREINYNKARLIIDGLKADPGRLMDIILSHPPYREAHRF
ncbi:MAG: shikimate kinase [Bacteroidales bacterium]|nr:shikimate kinase [Bacteroidales bacterium]